MTVRRGLGMWVVLVPVIALLALYQLDRARLASDGVSRESAEANLDDSDKEPAPAPGPRADPTITVTVVDNFDEPIPGALLEVFATGGVFLGQFTCDGQGIGRITLDGERSRLTGAGLAETAPSVVSESYRIKANSALIYEFELPGGGFDAQPVHELAVAVVGQAYVKDALYGEENGLTQEQVLERARSLEGDMQHAIEIVLVELEAPGAEASTPYASGRPASGNAGSRLHGDGPRPDPTIAIHVHDIERRPIPGAHVDVLRDGETVASATTDRRGNARIRLQGERARKDDAVFSREPMRVTADESYVVVVTSMARLRYTMPGQPGRGSVDTYGPRMLAVSQTFINDAALARAEGISGSELEQLIEELEGELGKALDVEMEHGAIPDGAVPDPTPGPDAFSEDPRPLVGASGALAGSSWPGSRTAPGFGPIRSSVRPR